MKFTSENVDVFLAVMVHGSFSAAARALGRAPSAVSMAVSAMEDELGFALFTRTNRDVKPTAEARALEQPARATADHLRRLSLHADALSLQLERELVVGIAQEADAGPVLAALKQLSSTFPLLRIEVISEVQAEVEALIQASKADLGVVLATGLIDPQRTFEAIGTERIIAVAGPQWEADARYERLEDLAYLPQVVVAARGHSSADTVTTIGSSTLYVNSVRVALEMVEAGIGWGNLPARLAEPLAREGRLKVLEFPNAENGLEFLVHVTWLKGRPLGTAAKELVRLLLGQHRGAAQAT